MQSKIAISYLLVVGFLMLAVQAQRRRPGRPGRRPEGRRPRPPFLDGADQYTWQVDIGGGALVEQKAMVNSDLNVTVVVSKDSVLADNNLTSSLALYHTSGIVAIRTFGGRGRRSRSPCFLTTTVSSFNQLEADIVSRNGSEVALPIDETTLNATGEPLTRQEARALFKAVRPLARFCRGKRLVETTFVTDASLSNVDLQEVQVKSTVSLEGQINIIVPNTPNGRPGSGSGPRPRPRPGNGSRPRPRPRSGNGSRPRPRPRPQVLQTPIPFQDTGFSFDSIAPNNNDGNAAIGMDINLNEI